MFGISRDNVSKLMIVFGKEKKNSQQSTRLAESRSCQRETIKLHIELLERTVELRHLKLLLSLKKHTRTICPQKLAVESYTKKIF